MEGDEGPSRLRRPERILYKSFPCLVGNTSSQAEFEIHWTRELDCLWAPTEGRDPYQARQSRRWRARRRGRESGVDESRLNGGDGRANPAGKQCRHG